ncbi:MAG TPA: glycine dehydrogenase, partial [Blastocatellia bacterium]
AHYAASRIEALPGYSLKFTGPYFNEFVVKTPRPAVEITERLLENKVVGGLPMVDYYSDFGDCLLVCVTETASKQAIDNLVSALGAMA